MKNTGDFYDTNANIYYQQTCNIDPSPFLSIVTQRLPPGANILDVGCGSGRDLLWLRQNGFHAQGLERSPHMAELARTHSGCHVTVGDFQSYTFSNLQCDAILMVGSLVHLTHPELPAVLNRIIKGLKQGGYMYLSLKQGKGASVTHQGRTFRLWQCAQLETIFSGLGLTTEHFSKNSSPIHPHETWLGYLLKCDA